MAEGKRPMRCLGTKPLAERLGVESGTITAWVTRFPPEHLNSFPVPDVEIEGDNYVTRGWKPERVTEIQRWSESRSESDRDRFWVELEELDAKRPGTVRKMYAGKEFELYWKLLTDERKKVLLNYLDHVER